MPRGHLNDGALYNHSLPYIAWGDHGGDHLPYQYCLPSFGPAPFACIRLTIARKPLPRVTLRCLKSIHLLKIAFNIEFPDG